MTRKLTDFDRGYDSAIEFFRTARREGTLRTSLRDKPALDRMSDDVEDSREWEAGWREAAEAVTEGENEAAGIDQRYGEDNRR